LFNGLLIPVAAALADGIGSHVIELQYTLPDMFDENTNMLVVPVDWE
jgi:hypothetical protein